MGVQKIKHAASLAEWRERILACRSSGLPVLEWCKRENINVKTYYRWERLCKNGREFRTTGKSLRLTGLCPDPRFIAFGFSGKSDVYVHTNKKEERPPCAAWIHSSREIPYTAFGSHLCVALSSATAKSKTMIPSGFGWVNIQSWRKPRSIYAESLLNFGGSRAQSQRF